MSDYSLVGIMVHERLRAIDFYLGREKVKRRLVQCLKTPNTVEKLPNLEIGFFAIEDKY